MVTERVRIRRDMMGRSCLFEQTYPSLARALVALRPQSSLV
ncbi:hypothetical protein ACVIHH_001332 [Bradyrhizobium sp. USDA 4518]